MPSLSASVPGSQERRSVAGPASCLGPEVESRDVRYAYSESLPAILSQLNSSLVISTYRTGNLVVVSAPRGRLAVSFHAFERPMGMAVRRGCLAVGTRTQVWFLGNASDIAAKLEPRGSHDACYQARTSHFTGDIQGHDMAWVSPSSVRGASDGDEAELWIVNTLFSCLCVLHASYSFSPRWRPPFVSALAPEDRCHLNGLAVADGQARFVTALAETDSAQGWRAAKVGAGCVIDVAGSQVIARGLTLPHSPRVTGSQLLLLHSGVGQLVSVDQANGKWETVAELPGYTRGLAIHDQLAFVGLSKIRAGSSLTGVPIAMAPERLRCGCGVVDLKTGRIVALFEFLTGIDELFDVQILPGQASPYFSGPFADRESGRPLWTVPPSH